jgi:uncharacterized membrane protein affecting hemolysin expression
MTGKIDFDNVEQLAEFLKHFTGSTAVFKAYVYDSGQARLEFTGGN